MTIQNAFDIIFEDDDACEPVKLKDNDIDVHHGTFSDAQIHENEAFQSASDSMSVYLSSIKCKAASGLTLDVNTVPCSNLSTNFF